MPRKTPRKRSPKSRVRASSGRFEALSVGLGDQIRVERRFIVDGVMTSVADKGIFHGIQAMGSVEHILLETSGEVRLIPIPSISEIVLEHAESKRGLGPGGFDPSFA